jgi:hypothetical protein
MASGLRALGALVVVLGLGGAAAAGWLLANDTGFGEAAAAYARHPEHLLFRTEYWVAAVRHYGLVAAVVGGLLGGLVLGGMLFGLAELLRRLPH